MLHLDAVRGTVGDDTLAATAVGSQHPDAELANLRVAGTAAVGTVTASLTSLENRGSDSSDSTLGSTLKRSGEGNAVERGDDDGGETHVDGLVGWLVGWLGE